jgi:hypothetical protein
MILCKQETATRLTFKECVVREVTNRDNSSSPTGVVRRKVTNPESRIHFISPTYNVRTPLIQPPPKLALAVLHKY